MWDQMKWKRMLNFGREACNKVLNTTIGKDKAKSLQDYGMNRNHPIHL